jgi:hypothetical protein
LNFQLCCNTALPFIVFYPKQQFLSDTQTGILGSIAGPCDFLAAWSDEFQKVW